MTSFQVILIAILQAISSLLPFSPKPIEDFLKVFLDWTPSSVELRYWITLLCTLVLLFIFRFDWLGILSAFLKTVVRPKSLNAAERTLDQQIVLFLLITSLPSILFRMAVHHQWIPIPEDFFHHPISMIIASIASFGFLQAGLMLNRRTRGLNHLRLIDAAVIGLILLLSVHPAFSVVLLVMSALAMTHYHSEAILKYSFLIVTLHLIGYAITLGSETNLHSVFAQLGVMNGIVVTVLTLVAAWVTLENLQKSFNLNSYEKTFRFFRWVQWLWVLGYGVVLFLQRGV